MASTLGRSKDTAEIAQRAMKVMDGAVRASDAWRRKTGRGAARNRKKCHASMTLLANEAVGLGTSTLGFVYFNSEGFRSPLFRARFARFWPAFQSLG
jgi:hypothetical protein